MVRGLKAALVLTTALACPVGFENGEVCSGHGACAEHVKKGIDETCICDYGFSGPDCSLRLCPAGRAWADYASANNTAHARHVECSNMGDCDRETGLCECRDGFGGDACQRMRCPTGTLTGSPARECYGYGRCISMRDAAREDIDWVSIHKRSTVYDAWDADMLYGCVCDAGFAGWDCSRRVCPKGDDPLTPGLDEVQLLECACSQPGGCANHSLTLTFKGQRTSPIPADATSDLLEHFLEELSSIKDVDVHYKGGGELGSLCSAGGTTARIVFMRDFGDVPAMNYSLVSSKTAAGESSSMVSMSIKTNGQCSGTHATICSVCGTKEHAECSNRGICSRDGACTCYTGFASSNGRGQSGSYADCGHLLPNTTIDWREDTQPKDYNKPWYRATDNLVDGPCPRVNPAWNPNLGPTICSGVGICDLDKKCNCTEGYEGNACEYKVCPSGRSWWDEAVGPNDGHNAAICSNRGACDRAAGRCDCDREFELMTGASCNLLECDVNKTACGQTGYCATMAELAVNGVHYNQDGTLQKVNYSDAWDAAMIRGCQCLKPEGVYHTSGPVHERNRHLPRGGSRMARPPWAFALTEWTGRTCSQALCPRGDNPFTWGENEIQEINCSAPTRGAFNLTFGLSNVSVRIPWHATASELELKLETLPTLRDVRVWYANSSTPGENETVCGKDQLAYVEFISDRGDVPMLVATTSPYSQIRLNISEFRKGSKENVECSGNGLCNRDVGVCNCLDGFASSTETNKRKLGEYGERGDCAFRHTGTKSEKWFTATEASPGYEYLFEVGVTGTEKWARDAPGGESSSS